MKKKVLSLVLMVCMIISLIPAAVLPAVALDDYSTWNEVGAAAVADTDYSVSGDTYTIKTAKGLAWLAKTVNAGDNFAGKTVLLANDINLDCGLVTGYGATTANETNSWATIGDITTSVYLGFGGTFDGQGHTVFGLHINNTKGNQGLFGIVKNATVKNLKIDNSSVKCKDDAGGIAGYIIWSTVDGCISSADVVSTEGRAGGITGGGGESNSVIKNCRNEGSVTTMGDMTEVGGIIGYGIDIIIVNCCNTGTIFADGTVSKAGGIAGCIQVSGSKVVNCFNTGAVTGSFTCGGIAESADNCEVNNCYFINNTPLGVGYGTGTTTSKTETEMKSADFVTLMNSGLDTLADTTLYTWKAVAGGYPTFDTLWTSLPATWNEVGAAAVTGTDYSVSGDTYTIKTAKGLAWLAKTVNDGNKFAGKTVLLANDINLDCGLVTGYGATTANETNSWATIGYIVFSPTTINRGFGGTFDGQGHTVSGLYINNTKDYQGLFGNVIGATVKNLKITDSSVKCAGNAAAIAGTITGTTVDGCISSAVVESATVSAGGIIGGGGSNDTVVKNCRNEGSVTGLGEYSKVGGIVGNGFEITIINCCNTGAVFADNADSNTGGIAGDIDASTSKIVNCFNTGAVTGNGTLGGVVGRVANGTVNNCYFINNTPLGVGYGTGTTASKTDAEMKSADFVTLMNSGLDTLADTTLYTWKAVAGGYPTFDILWVPRTATVTFMANGHGTAPSAIDDARIEEKITAPTAPSEAGFRFEGWYKEAGCVNKWNFDIDTVAADIDLFAKWVEKTAVSITETAQTYTYDTTAKSFAVSGTPTGGYSVEYLVSGAYTATAPSAAGSYKVRVTRTEDDDYKAFSKEIAGALVINTAIPTYTTPAGLTATYGETLADVSLPNGFTWEDATTTSVGGAGDNGFTVKYTPDDTANYSVINNISVTVKVSPIVAEIAWSGDTGHIYNGSSKTVSASVSNKLVGDSVNITLGGDVTKSDAGNYTATAVSLDNANYTLVGATGTSRAWSIERLDIAGSVSTDTDAIFGRELTANYTGSETVSYQWNRGGVAISGATANKYTPSSADIGAVITVTVNGAGNYKGSGTSADTNAVRTLTVTFDARGGSAVSAITGLAYNSTVTVPTSGKTNYGLNGWFTGVAGAGDKLGAATKITEDVTYYAHWTASAFDITYNYNGGRTYSGIDNPDTYSVESAAITLNNPARAGYSFLGWSGTGIADISKSVTIPTGSTGARSYIANWKRNSSAEPVYKKPSEKKNPFGDVKDDEWFIEDVLYMLEKGIMQGLDDTTFGPFATTERCMIVTVLWRLEGEPKAKTGAGFKDTDGNAYYNEALNWAVENEIVEGYDKDTFGAVDTMTREQLVTILFRYAKYKGCDTSARADLSGYGDAANVSSWATEAMSWAVASGIIEGIGEKTLAPGGSAQRCQLAAILHRFCEKYE